MISSQKYERILNVILQNTKYAGGDTFEVRYTNMCLNERFLNEELRDFEQIYKDNIVRNMDAYDRDLIPLEYHILSYIRKAINDPRY